LLAVGREPHLGDDVPRVGELLGVGEEVGEHLPEPVAVADDVVGDALVDEEAQVHGGPVVEAAHDAPALVQDEVPQVHARQPRAQRLVLAVLGVVHRLSPREAHHLHAALAGLHDLA
ncbi:unnamed protein product, partial [Heterosigma akashiwo]